MVVLVSSCWKSCCCCNSCLCSSCCRCCSILCCCRWWSDCCRCCISFCWSRCCRWYKRRCRWRWCRSLCRRSLCRCRSIWCHCCRCSCRCNLTDNRTTWRIETLMYRVIFMATVIAKHMACMYVLCWPQQRCCGDWWGGRHWRHKSALWTSSFLHPLFTHRIVWDRTKRSFKKWTQLRIKFNRCLCSTQIWNSLSRVMEATSVY